MVDVPLTIGARESFTRVREGVLAARFDERSICGALGIEHLWQVGSLDVAKTPLSPAGDDALALLIRAFLCLERVPVAAARRLLGDAEFDACTALGLLVESNVADMCESPVLLYPVRDVLLASDRHRNPDGSAFSPPHDAVFPAIFPGTTRFLRLLPVGSFDSALDLGSGTGVGALLLAATSRHAVATDVTQRSCHFADFNRRLNDRPGVEVACGSLYEPVPGRDFDCIVAHPPYMPTESDSYVFRDGGETGESLLRQIVSGAPAHLRPGGTLLALSAAWDTATTPFEERVREWLAEHGDPDEYHVMLAVETEMPAPELAEQLERRGRSGGHVSTPEAGAAPRDAAAWSARFEELGLVRHVYGALVITRLAQAGSGSAHTLPRGATRRTSLGARADGEAVIAAMRHMTWRAEQEAAGTLTRTLAGLRARLPAETRLHVTYAPGDGGLAPMDVVLERDEPFRSRTRVEPWMLALLGALDGERSLDALHVALRTGGALPDGFGMDALAELAATMLERGYLDGDY